MYENCNNNIIFIVEGPIGHTDTKMFNRNIRLTCWKCIRRINGQIGYRTYHAHAKCDSTRREYVNTTTTADEDDDDDNADGMTEGFYIRWEWRRKVYVKGMRKYNLIIGGSLYGRLVPISGTHDEQYNNKQFSVSRLRAKVTVMDYLNFYYYYYLNG